MIIKTFIKTGVYFDSVKLMLVTQKIKTMPNIIEAGVVMGTDLNKDILERVNLLSNEAREASAADLIVGINAENEDAINSVMAELDTILNSSNSSSGTEHKPKTISSALKIQPDSNMAIISIPGRFAKIESMKALSNGLNVLLFSDNIAIEDEKELKDFAESKGLLLMGPDCGTSIINQVPLGFANKVRSGAIGVVGASGTGIQEVTTLIHKQGLGISHAIGTGGRDLKLEVGGITMLRGIKALNSDENTEVIVLISKPPAKEIADKIINYIKNNIKKPVVINFLGGKFDDKPASNIEFASTLEEAALKAVQLAGKNDITNLMSFDEIENIVSEQSKKIGANKKNIRGLFSGGTLNYEAILVLEDLVGNIYSNTPVNKNLKLKDPYKLENNSCIDLGDDDFTIGRAHPMIDPTLRMNMLEQQLNDADASVILLDMVIGYGANDKPAEGIVDLLNNNKSKLANKTVITSICGTNEDPQNYTTIKKALEEAGVIVTPSNRCAAIVAGMIINK